MDMICRYPSPLGGMTLASDGNALVGLWFDGQRRFGVAPDGECAGSGDRALEQAARWLDLYFSGRDPGFTPPLAPRGSDFCQRVWRALMRVPYGRTVTYGQLAAGLHCRSAQAVGGAVGRNPIALIIPCHRVLGADGGLVGYAAGLDRKARLLTLEGAAIR